MIIKAVLIDLDDTLYDEKQFVFSGYRAVSSYMAKKYGFDERRFYLLLLEIFQAQGRRNVFDSALKKLDLYKRDIIKEMVETYQTHFPSIVLSKETAEILSKIKKKFHTGLITDGIKGVQENKVKALKLQEFFDVILYASEYGGKNNSAVFLTALEKLDVRTSESMYVDDNPYKGLPIAKKLGIRTVRILKADNKTPEISENQLKPDYEIKNLRELCDILRLA